MIDIKVYREYWEGVQKRVPEIKKVLPLSLIHIYERFRKVALGIYRQAGIIEFTTIETTPIKNV